MASGKKAKRKAAATNWVEVAVEKAGGATKAQAILCVSYQTFTRWRRRGEIQQLAPALRLAAATGIAVEKFAREEG